MVETNWANSFHRAKVLEKLSPGLKPVLFFYVDAFYCNQGMALSRSMVCNGYPDCPNGEDEMNCPEENYQQSSSVVSLDDALRYQPSSNIIAEDAVYYQPYSNVININDQLSYQPFMPSDTQPYGAHNLQSSPVLSLNDANFDESIVLHARYIYTFQLININFLIAVSNP